MRDKKYLKYLEESKLLEESTKKTYLSKLGIIKNDIWKNCKSVKHKVGKGKCLDYILKHPEAFIEKLDEFVNNTGGRLDKNKLSMHAKDSYVTALKSIFQQTPGMKQKHPDLFKKWDEIHKEVRRPINEKYQSNKPTERQEEAYISFEKIEEIRNKLEKGSDQKLLISMYTMIPPLRSDYDKIAIYKKETDKKDEIDNYLILNKKPYLIITKYKTSKTYKDLKINLPKNLVTEIKASLKKKPRNFLFIQKNGMPYDKPNTFNRWANRTLKKYLNKKNISLSTLRHIYITRRDLKLEEKSGLERAEISKVMGHSLGTQQNYLWHTYVKEEKRKKDKKEDEKENKKENKKEK